MVFDTNKPMKYKEKKMSSLSHANYYCANQSLITRMYMGGGCYKLHSLPEPAALPRAQALGKAFKALDKAFAERSSRQSALDENLIDKGLFAESRLSGTRQNICRVPNARQSAK
jgi:hypothetical protein